MFKILRTLVLYCLTIGPAMAASVDDLKIMTENYPPFNFEKDGTLQGISVDTMVLMLQRVQSEQTREDIRLLPWARGYELVLSEPNTGLFSTTRTEERENLFKWVGPIAPNKVGLIARKDRQIEIESVDDIRKYKIGTIRDDVAETLLVKAGVPLSDMQRVGENLQNIRKLKLGRIDLWAYGESVAMWDILANGFNVDEYESVYVFSEQDLYFAFHKDTPDSVLQALQGALDGLKADGEFEKILDRYLKN